MLVGDVEHDREPPVAYIISPSHKSSQRLAGLRTTPVACPGVEDHLGTVPPCETPARGFIGGRPAEGWNRSCRNENRATSLLPALRGALDDQGWARNR